MGISSTREPVAGRRQCRAAGTAEDAAAEIVRQQSSAVEQIRCHPCESAGLVTLHAS